MTFSEEIQIVAATRLCRLTFTVGFILACFSSCLHFPVAPETCNLKCYGVEAIKNKWCLGMFNYNKCYDKAENSGDAHI